MLALRCLSSSFLQLPGRQAHDTVEEDEVVLHCLLAGHGICPVVLRQKLEPEFVVRRFIVLFDLLLVEGEAPAQFREGGEDDFVEGHEDGHGAEHEHSGRDAVDVVIDDLVEGHAADLSQA